jgi:hypothetical protein
LNRKSTPAGSPEEKKGSPSQVYLASFEPVVR